MVTSEARASDWTQTQRLAFRFGCAYFVLYIFPFPLGVIPLTSPLIEPYGKMWNAIVPWVGKHVLHLNHEITVLPPQWPE